MSNCWICSGEVDLSIPTEVHGCLTCDSPAHMKCWHTYMRNYCPRCEESARQRGLIAGLGAIIFVLVLVVLLLAAGAASQR